METKWTATIRSRLKWGGVVFGLILLIGLPRLTDLNQYVIVDEADRWRWAKDFVDALSRGDLAATLVGDGYPGIVPVWAESGSVFLEAGRRSLIERRWIGQAGLYQLFHEWDREEFLAHQRFPIVLLNTAIALLIVGAVWRLFGLRVALVGGLLIALDPFYLSDSRVNRAEAVITGLMTLAMLFLIFYDRQRRLRYVILSGVFGGLSLLTKIQALAIAPAIALTGVLIYFSSGSKKGSVQDFRTDWGARGVSPRIPPGLSEFPKILDTPGRKQEVADGENQGPGGKGQAASSKRPSLFTSRPTPYALLPTASFFLSLLKFGLIWTAAAGLTWLLLWPSMWVVPLETLALVYDYTTRKVGAEGVSLFFWGETYIDADPGFLFYPIVFFMRITPLVLTGLLAAALRFTVYNLRPLFGKASTAEKDAPLPGDPFTTPGSAILVVYIVAYTIMMTLGSHKQDRYLMPVFLCVDILAAMGLVYLGAWLKNKIPNLQSPNLPISNLSTTPKNASEQASQLPITNYQLLITNLLRLEWLLFAALLVIQLAVVLPHHPYYYSYFNPLFGGGRVAVDTLRIGWGEGMDQVGRYLAAKPNSRDLVVSTRFTHNMPAFKGALISLTPGGRWTRADYIVLYIQQVQRHIDPDPDFIDYFQARQPEKVITLGGIDYAWIYPVPFTTPADPTVSLISGRAALLGYRWETNALPAQTTLRLFWRNLGLTGERRPAVRLVSPAAQTEWTPCLPAPGFAGEAHIGGRYVESLCKPTITALPAGIYTVEVGLGDDERIDKFLFPEGWQAARLTHAGQVADTEEIDRLEAIAAEKIPPQAQRVNRVYDGRLSLVAYHLDPPTPQPGETLSVALYWQPVQDLLRPLDLTAQLADSRSISLGRTDTRLYTPPAEGEIDEAWLPGAVISTHHAFDLPPDLDTPLAAQLEATVRDEAEVALQPTTLAGERLDKSLARFTVAPAVWPAPANAEPVEVGWSNGLTLRGYRLSAATLRPGDVLAVTLLWEAERPIEENYVVFIHLVDQAGRLTTQNDSLPRAGAYPTPWWLPGRPVEDTHALSLPEALTGGRYRLVTGLYSNADGTRLPLSGGDDHLTIGTIEVTP